MRHGRTSNDRVGRSRFGQASDPEEEIHAALQEPLKRPPEKGFDWYRTEQPGIWRMSWGLGMRKLAVHLVYPWVIAVVS